MKKILSIITILFCSAGQLAWGKVQLGIDQLFTEAEITTLVHQRLGIIAHKASVSQAGQNSVDLIFQDPRLDLKMIFSPEHGFRTHDDDYVGDSTDPITGLPVYSLYSQTRSAPEPAQLAQIDALLIDLQDVGMRFYTYGATMAKAIRAAAENNVPVYILDRPNPIGGVQVMGPMLEPELENNLVSFANTPMRHGMTMGELAFWFNSELNINADLHVIKMKNWDRKMQWEDTGLNWIPPSPALERSEQALFYSLLGPLEALNLAVGRGKENSKAFEYYGAPWISPAEATRIVAKLNRQFEHIQFQTVSWLVTRREYEGQICNGFKIIINNEQEIASLPLLLTTISILKEELGEKLIIKSFFDRFVGQRWIRQELNKLTPVEMILTQIAEDARFLSFLKRRNELLLY